MILPYQTKFRVDYQDQKLNNVFILNNQEKVTFNYDGDTIFYGAPVWSELFEVAHCLMIATPVLDNNQIIKELQALSKKGIAVFLLLGKPELSQKAIDSLAGYCCIRAGVAQNGSLIIADHGYSNSFALILSASVGNNDLNQYLSRLDENQEEEYFDIYCRLFWHEAKFEYLSQSHKLSRAVKNDSSPVQEISVAHKHVFPTSLPNYLSETLSQATHLYSQGDGGKLWNLFELDKVDIMLDADIWFNLNQVSSLKLSQSTQKSKHIFLTEKPLIQMVNTENEAWLLPEQNNIDHYNWVLKLSASQMVDCMELNDEISKTKNWQLNSQITVADIKSPVRYLEKIEHETLWKNSIELDLGKIECTDFEEYESVFQQGGALAFSNKRNLVEFDRKKSAKSISYSIDIQPPRLPLKAIEDKLHQQWTAAQEKWNGDSSSLQCQLDKIESRKTNLTDNVRNLMASFLTGQLNSQRTLQKELTQLSQIELHVLSSSQRNEQQSKIQKVADSILNRGKKLTDEQDKAEQQLQWQKKETKLNHDIQSAEKNLLTLNDDFSSFKAKNKGALDDKITLLSDGWLEFLTDTRLVDDKEKERLIDFEADEIGKWIDEQLGKQASSKKKRKPQKINNNIYETLHRDLKNIRMLSQNYKLQSAALTKEKEKLIKAINSAQAHLERTQEDLKKHGSFQPRVNDTQQALSKLLGINKSKNNSFIIELPNEDLPLVGELYLKEQQRYLVIKAKNDIEQAKLDCVRLNAKLVVEKDC